MRVKLLSESKQLPLKCWYAVATSEKKTVLDLKKQLVCDFQLDYQPDELMLEMDQFELLQQSKISDVLRDNDTLSVQLIGKKRKTTESIKETNDEEEVQVEKKCTKKQKTDHNKKTKEQPKKVVKHTKKAAVIEAKKPSINEKQKKDTEKTKTEKKKSDSNKAEKKKKSDSNKAEKKKKKRDSDKTEKKANKKSSKKAAKIDDKEKKTKADGEKKMKQKEKEKADSKKKETAKNKAETKSVVVAKKPGQAIILTKTQRRNLRRRMLKQQKMEQKQNNQSAPAAPLAEKEVAAVEDEEQPRSDIQGQSAVVVSDQGNNPDTVTSEEQFNDYNPYGRALVTSIECAPHFRPKKKNNNNKHNNHVQPREYPVHKVPPIFYAQQAIENYFVPQTNEGYNQHDTTMEEQHNSNEAQEADQEVNEVVSKTGEKNNNQEDVTMEEKKDEESEDESSDDDDDDDDEEESDSEDNEKEGEGEKDDSENKEKEKEESQVEAQPVAIDYDTLPVINFNDSPPNVNDRLAIKMLELTSAYTPEISNWKHVLLKEIDMQSQAVVIEFEKGFGKASTKGGKFDIKKKKKKRNHWYRGRGRRNYSYDDEEYEEEEEEEEDEDQDNQNAQQQEEEETVVVLMSDIFEIRKL